MQPHAGVALLAAMVVLSERVAAQEPGPAWAFNASAYLYADADPDFLLPVITADRGALHLEGRYNYEDLETVSAWVGWTLETGESVHLALTPMVGGTVGRTDGVAPGVELTLGWRSLELYSESELLVPLDGQDAYLYTWTQATWSPLAWLSLGLSGQRLRAPESDLLIDRGPMATVQLGPVSLQAFFYNPCSDDAFTVLGASIDF